MTEEMKIPTLYTYEREDGWFGHIDRYDGTSTARQGPFTSKSQAAAAVCQSNGIAPPSTWTLLSDPPGGIN